MTDRGRRTARRPGRHPARAGIALAGLALAAAGCGHVLPLGLAAVPAPSHLASAITLQPAVVAPARSAVIVSPSGSPAAPAPPPPASCPAGYGRLPSGDEPPGSAGCYRKLGPPATFTTAAVTVFHQPGGPKGQPASYMLRITLPATEAATLTAVTTSAAGTQVQLAIIIANQTWAAPITLQPLTSGEFAIPVRSLSQALQLQRILLQPA